MTAKRLASGHYLYKGWEIEKVGTNQWNMKPEGEDFWTDAAYSLTDAKVMIDRWQA